MRIFTVISPHIRDFDSILTQTLDFFRDKTMEAYIVKETGKKGTHPHLNVIWSTNLHKKYFSQKLKEYFKAPNSNERLLKHKTVFNEEKLRNEYLSKESNAQVIYDHTQQLDTHQLLLEQFEELRALKRRRRQTDTGTKSQFEYGFDLLENIRLNRESTGKRPPPIIYGII